MRYVIALIALLIAAAAAGAETWPVPAELRRAYLYSLGQQAADRILAKMDDSQAAIDSDWFKAAIERNYEQTPPVKHVSITIGKNQYVGPPGAEMHKWIQWASAAETAAQPEPARPAPIVRRWYSQPTTISTSPAPLRSAGSYANVSAASIGGS